VMLLRIDTVNEALLRWAAGVTEEEYSALLKGVNLSGDSRTLQTLAAVGQMCADAKTGATPTTLAEKLLGASLGLQEGGGQKRQAQHQASA
jgi:hypothetical protein